MGSYFSWRKGLDCHLYKRKRWHHRLLLMTAMMWNAFFIRWMFWHQQGGIQTPPRAASCLLFLFAVKSSRFGSDILVCMSVLYSQIVQPGTSAIFNQCQHIDRAWYLGIKCFKSSFSNSLGLNFFLIFQFSSWRNLNIGTGCKKLESLWLVMPDLYPAKD